jgi:hypothetical protein
VTKEVGITLNNVSEKRNDGGQHACLNRTTLKPQAEEDVFGLVGVGVFEFKWQVSYSEFTTRDQPFELNGAKEPQQCTVSLGPFEKGLVRIWS